MIAKSTRGLGIRPPSQTVRTMRLRRGHWMEQEKEKGHDNLTYPGSFISITKTLAVIGPCVLLGSLIGQLVVHLCTRRRSWVIAMLYDLIVSRCVSNPARSRSNSPSNWLHFRSANPARLDLAMHTQPIIHRRLSRIGGVLSLFVRLQAVVDIPAKSPQRERWSYRKLHEHRQAEGLCT